MGDTVKVVVTEDWSAISGLTTDAKYGFQNITNESMYLNQQSTTPDDTETGFTLAPYKMAIILKESNSIFIRMKVGNGVVYFNEIES